MITRNGDRVLIDISDTDFMTLMLTLGYAAGSALELDRSWMLVIVRLLNSINEGNPNYRPYKLPD